MVKAIEVFSRHFPVIGKNGQKRLLKSKVVVVGAGALGSWETYFLRKLGVGKITVIDRDFVEELDIPRTIYEKEHIGRPKAEVLSEILDVEGIVEDLNPSTVDLLEDADVILDGTDNVYTRHVINDYCVKTNKPWVYVGVLATYGNVMPIIPGETACYRCLFPEMPKRPLPTCAVAGIMSYVPTLAASIAVSMVSKILLGEKIEGSMIYFDARTFEFEKINISRKDDCGACVKRDFIFLEKRTRVERMCDGAYHIIPSGRMNIDLDEFEKSIKALGVTYYRASQFVRFSDGDYEVSVFSSGRVIIRGAKDDKEAKSIYARYIGI